MYMFKTENFTGKFDDTILFEQLLPQEPATIARKVYKELSSSDNLNINCTVNMCITDDMKQFCEYVYKHDYIDVADCKFEQSYIHFIDLKAPVGVNIYFVVLRISRSVCETSGKVYISISICYVQNKDTNIRLLQYGYDRHLLEASKSTLD